MDNGQQLVPAGWSRTEVTRKSGLSKGKIDIYIYSPKGKCFRSKKELSNYLQTHKLPLNIGDFNFSVNNTSEKLKNTTNKSMSSICTEDSEGSSISSNVDNKVDNKSEDLDIIRRSAINAQSETPKTSDTLYEGNIESTPKDLSMTNDESLVIINNESNCVLTVNTSLNISTQTDSINLGICLEVLGNGFVSDDMIQLYFQIINNNNIIGSNVYFISPAISQTIKCLNDIDFLLEPLEMDTKSFIFIPVSDAEASLEISGQHWSLLLYVKHHNSFYHFDSINQLNLPSAQDIVSKVSKYLDTTEKSLNIVRSPQQNNGVDCGIYLTLTVEWLLKQICAGDFYNHLDKSFSAFNIEEHQVISMRSLLAYLTYNNQYQKLSLSVIKSLLFNSEMSNSRKVNPDLAPSNASLKNDHINDDENCRWKQIKQSKRSSSKNGSLNQQNSFSSHPIMTVNSFKVLEGIYDESTISESILKIAETFDDRESSNPPITTQNIRTRKPRDDVFQNKKEKKDNNFHRQSLNKVKVSKLEMNFSPQLPKRKITLFADSQGKDLAYKLETMMDNMYNVFGHIQSGAFIDKVLEPMTNDSNLESFGVGDWIVIMGGCNDLSDLKTITNSETYHKKIISTIESHTNKHKNTNVIISTIPYRYDLPQNDHRQNVVSKVNEEIRKLIDKHRNTHLLDLWLLKSFQHTKHGFHINNKGKAYVNSLIKQIVVGSNEGKTNSGHDQLNPAVFPGIEVIDKDMPSPSLQRLSTPQSTDCSMVSGSAEPTVSPGHLQYSEAVRQTSESAQAMVGLEQSKVSVDNSVPNYDLFNDTDSSMKDTNGCKSRMTPLNSFPTLITPPR